MQHKFLADLDSTTCKCIRDDGALAVCRDCEREERTGSHTRGSAVVEVNPGTRRADWQLYVGQWRLQNGRLKQTNPGEPSTDR